MHWRFNSAQTIKWKTPIYLLPKITPHTTALTPCWQPDVSVTTHIVLHCQSSPQYCIQLHGGGIKSPVSYLKREKRERKNKHLSHEIKNFLCTISHRIHYHVTSHHGTTHGCWWNSRISFITYATTTTQRWKFLAS